MDIDIHYGKSGGVHDLAEIHPYQALGMRKRELAQAREIASIREAAYYAKAREVVLSILEEAGVSVDRDKVWEGTCASISGELWLLESIDGKKSEWLFLMGRERLKSRFRRKSSVVTSFCLNSNPSVWKKQADRISVLSWSDSMKALGARNREGLPMASGLGRGAAK